MKINCFKGCFCPKEERIKNCHPEFISGSHLCKQVEEMLKRVQHDNKIMGFTLIELLVVVLIIGILAAVAVPQYKLAVVKSRFSRIQPIIAALKRNNELYYLTNGEYPTYRQGNSYLDISLPCPTVQHGNVFKCDPYFLISSIDSTKGFIRADYCPKNQTNWDRADGCHYNYDFEYKVWLDKSDSPGRVACYSKTDLGRKICNKVK